MRGFLSKWFNRKSEERSLPRSHGEEPVLSAEGKPHRNYPRADEHDHFAHPDTEFLDYEDLASENAETPTSQNTTSQSNQLSQPDIVDANGVIPDAEWVEEYQVDTANTRELEINSETQNVAEEKKLGAEDKEPVELPSSNIEAASESDIEKWEGWVNASFVPPNTLKGDSDPSGNTYLHYAAILGSPQFCVELLKKGWDAKSKNNLGQTAIDLARSNDRQNTALLMELFTSQQITSISTADGIPAQSKPHNKTKEKQKPSPEIITKEDEIHERTRTKNKQRETIRKSRLTDDYNSNQSNNLSTTIAPSATIKSKQKNTPPTKPKTSLSETENALWNILVRDSRCPNEIWGYLMDSKDADSSGNTLLHYATRAGNISYALHLAELGWGVLVKNNDGETPLDVARRAGHIDIVHTLSEKKYSSPNDKTTDEDIARALSDSEKLPTADHPSASANNIQQKKQPITSPPSDQLEMFENTQQVYDPIETPIDKPDQVNKLKSKAQSACIKCGASFSDFNAAIKLWFCPFCGTEQPDNEAPLAIMERQPDYNGEDTDFSENASDYFQSDSLEEVFLEEDPYTSPIELHDAGKAPNEHKQTQRSKSLPVSFPEDSFNGVDEGLDEEIIDIDLQSHQPVPRGRNSSDENYYSSGDWSGPLSENTPTEEWEIFLDEDLEEQSHPFDQYFEDEDPLEQGKIVEYASRLTSRITYYQSKDRHRIYAFFISVLGDFPFYQSYAAIERLIARDVQFDQIQDTYSVKRLWMTNPNVWSSRRYNRMENAWSVSRNSKLRNSMSWQLASDLVNFHTPNELENLILNDWYSEWLNLPLHGGDTASGLDPAYSLYPTHLYEKRRLLMANVNTW